MSLRTSSSSSWSVLRPSSPVADGERSLGLRRSAAPGIIVARSPTGKHCRVLTATVPLRFTCWTADSSPERGRHRVNDTGVSAGIHAVFTFAPPGGHSGANPPPYDPDRADQAHCLQFPTREDSPIMNRISPRLRWTVALLLALGLVAAACGSDDKKSDSSGDSTTTAKSKELAAATLNGSGSTFQQAYDETVIERLQVGAAGRHDHVRAAAARARARPTSRPASSSGPARTAFPPQPTCPSTRARSSTSRPSARRSRSRTTSRASTSCSSPRTRSPGSSRATIKTWNDAKIKADNPTRPCPSTKITVAHRSDGSGTTAELHQVPDQGGADHLEARHGQDGGVAHGSAGRQRQRGCGPDRQGHRGRDRLRRLLGRQGGRPEVRGDQERVGQVRGGFGRRRHGGDETRDGRTRTSRSTR